VTLSRGKEPWALINITAIAEMALEIGSRIAERTTVRKKNRSGRPKGIGKGTN
jgi:hypothetical protein